MLVQVRSDAARARLKKIATRIENGTQRTLENVIAATTRGLKSTRAFKDQTGNLRRSIQSYTKSIRVGERYGRYVEYGNAPRGGDGHIYPTRAKYLRFKVGGHWVTAARVKAAKARPFMRPARDQAQALLSRGVRATVSSAVRGRGG